MEKPASKKVLICPLDWGLGHATRCVPVIKSFAAQGFDVVIAAGGRPYEFLKEEFPEIRIITFPGTKIRYQTKISFSLKLTLQIFKLLSGFYKEKRFLKKIIRKEKPDIILSDNRYGVRNRNVYSIFMTHQLQIMVPAGLNFLKPVINGIIRNIIRKFDEIWVPDYQQHNGIAGKLSHPPESGIPVKYIGTLSRFAFFTNYPDNVPLLFDIVVILSGPEPQRTILEEIIFGQVRDTGLRGIIIRGITEEKSAFDLTPSIRVYSHLDTASLNDCLNQAEIIISRSGYSGIMDLVTLGKKAILIPTPGQTEQEYLAKYLMDKKIFFSIPQENFDLLYAIEMSRNYPGIVIKNDLKILNEQIRRLSC